MDIGYPMDRECIYLARDLAGRSRPHNFRILSQIEIQRKFLETCLARIRYRLQKSLDGDQEGKAKLKASWWADLKAEHLVNLLHNQKERLKRIDNGMSYRYTQFTHTSHKGAMITR